jgi:CRISPR-associated endoribonuclease Cas6
MEYHKDIQGLIYGLLSGSEYDVHEKNGFKFFTFSNIFPFFDLRKNDRRNLLIASPNKEFVSYLKDQLEYLRDIRIGAMKFSIDACSKFDIRLPSDVPVTLITGTPILCNIHRYRFEEANALHLVNGFDSTYWRSTHPVDLFLRQVEANLVKKFSAYHGIQAATADADVNAEPGAHQMEPISYKSRFLKQIAIPLSMGQGKYRSIVIGTNWLFGFADPQMATFALDAGLGELNSLGFGFMNVRERQRGRMN